MGDSNAEMMIPAFERLARDENLTLSVAVRSGCPWQRATHHLSVEIIADGRRSKADW